MRQIVIEDAAKDDLRQSAKYLDQERPGIGRDFMAEITATLDRIAHYPLSAPVVWNQFRRARVPRFRYDIIYAVEPERIVIVAVVHQRRHPDFWKDRI